MKILYEDGVDFTQILMRQKKTHSEHLFEGLKTIFLNLWSAKRIELLRRLSLFDTYPLFFYFKKFYFEFFVLFLPTKKKIFA